MVKFLILTITLMSQVALADVYMHGLKGGGRIVQARSLASDQSQNVTNSSNQGRYSCTQYILYRGEYICSQYTLSGISIDK